ncbi:hypothetical protein CEXT_55191 [Caerostris extrusa]|uniref:Uncharacterized protein n=1 Tax=Caerostris extrusa TaxID=172846 RepID=A0AAV4WNY8_CAEEX|nr:hypothetical protein CEXT_55191 [Caerostris extrusa]
MKKKKMMKERSPPSHFGLSSLSLHKRKIPQPIYPCNTQGSEVKIRGRCAEKTTPSQHSLPRFLVKVLIYRTLLNREEMEQG